MGKHQQTTKSKREMNLRVHHQRHVTFATNDGDYPFGLSNKHPATLIKSTLSVLLHQYNPDRTSFQIFTLEEMTRMSSTQYVEPYPAKIPKLSHA